MSKTKLIITLIIGVVSIPLLFLLSYILAGASLTDAHKNEQVGLTVAIFISILLLIALTPVAAIFVVRGFASIDIIWTIPKQERAIWIVRGDQPQRVIMSSDKFILRRDDPSWDKTTGNEYDLVENPQLAKRVKLRRNWVLRKAGAAYLGIPYLDSILETTQSWLVWETNSQGIRVIVPHTAEPTRYLFLTIFPYAFMLKDAEDINGLPLNIPGTFYAQPTNVYTPIFGVTGYLDLLRATVTNGIREQTKDSRYVSPVIERILQRGSQPSTGVPALPSPANNQDDISIHSRTFPERCIQRLDLENIRENIGYCIKRIECDDIAPSIEVEGVVEAQLEVETAELKAAATVKTAEGQKRAKILQGEGDKQVRILQGEGEKSYQESVGEGHKKRFALEGEGLAANASKVDPATIAGMRNIETFADSKVTTISGEGVSLILNPEKTEETKIISTET